MATMQVKWKRLFFQTTLWLATEIILTSIGLDDLADFTEYHIASKLEAGIELLNSPTVTIV